MKNYSEHPSASISVSGEEYLERALKKIAPSDIDVIIETGTYLGLGSTRIFASVFCPNGSDCFLFTIENNFHLFTQARKNLKRFRNVKCLYGDTMDKYEMIQFIKEDIAIKDHSKYEEIFIDDVRNPQDFYLNEILGNLHQGYWTLGEFLLNKMFRKKTNLLERLISNNIEKRLLFVLDSAGGIGFLEFHKVMSLMMNKPFYIFLDDINHLKHFRSLNFINSNNSFEIIEINVEHGWLLAHFRPHE